MIPATLGDQRAIAILPPMQVVKLLGLGVGFSLYHVVSRGTDAAARHLRRERALTVFGRSTSSSATL